MPRLRPVGRAVRAWPHAPWGPWLCLAGGLLGGGVHAQNTPDALAWELSPQLSDRLPGETVRQAPTFVSGQRIRGVTDQTTVVEGEAELRRHDMVLRADRLEHTQANDTVLATGQVRINRYGDVYEGPELRLKLDTGEGHFLQPRFSLLKNGGQGDAARLDFLDKDRAVATDARYSTCQRPPGGAWTPAWMVTARSIEFDNAQDTGTAHDGVLRFQDVPILAAPWISFPLSDQRKSGVLPPTLNLDNQSGLEITLPYYLNLAPNADATLYPTVMSKRGIDLGGEFRYLEPSYSGQLRGAYMPSDRLRDANRWALSFKHQQALPDWGPNLGLRLNLNRVSDDQYWRDFPRTSTQLTERLLPSEAVLNWGSGPWSFVAGSYRWQTLQDVTAPIVAPYDRVPSLGMRYTPAGFGPAGGDGWEASLQGEVTRFATERPTSALDGDGTRALLVAQLSKAWRTPGWYVKPALQVHARQYNFEQAFGDRPRNASYTIPTVSVDAGLAFERDTQYLGRDFVQTLEPRALYVQTPYRDQRFLPAYDTAAYDFNLTSIFSTNPYGGHDRIADLHALTLGATSRLLDPTTGAEVLQLGVAQRVRLSDQRVLLNETEPLTQRLSDVLLGARVNWSPRWSTQATVQYNQDDNRAVRTTLGVRYNPTNYRVLNLAYRLKRAAPESEQIDVGWQWPLNDLFGQPAADRPLGRGLGSGQWYSVGRINYSMTDSKVVDLLAGLEYDGDCWIGRVVLERLQQSRATANQRILFQLEFVGFSRIGSNPLQTLKDNVPRYQFLRQDINPPSRFERYE